MQLQKNTYIGTILQYIVNIITNWRLILKIHLTKYWYIIYLNIISTVVMEDFFCLSISYIKLIILFFIIRKIPMLILKKCSSLYVQNRNIYNKL